MYLPNKCLKLIVKSNYLNKIQCEIKVRYLVFLSPKIKKKYCWYIDEKIDSDIKPDMLLNVIKRDCSFNMSAKNFEILFI